MGKKPTFYPFSSLAWVLSEMLATPLAEFERANLLERQKEGIAIAKENGAYKGRKEIDFPTNWIEIYIKYKTRELTGTKAMEQLGLKRNTFYKLVKEHEEGK